MGDADIRWRQRFSNYQKALAQLTKFMEKSDINELEEQGLIQAFEYTHELAWKTLADLLKSRGSNDLYGSKDVTREAFALDLLENGEIWMEMIASRNLTSHTYSAQTTAKIISALKNNYYPSFILLEKKLSSLAI